MATSSHDGGGATWEGKSLGARRARPNQLKADPLPSARPPPKEIVFGTGRPAPRLRGRAALGPSPISNVDSRAAVDRGATLPPAKRGEGGGSGKSQSVTSPWSRARRGEGFGLVVVAVDPSSSAAMGAWRPRRAAAKLLRGPGVARRDVREEGTRQTRSRRR